MTVFTNSEIVQNILPALEQLGSRELRPLGNLQLYKVRKVFMEHWSGVESVRQQMLKHRASPGEDGQLVIDIAGNVIFDQDPAVAAQKRAEFVAAYNELLAGTFECGLTINLEAHIGENIPPANVLLGLGELLVLPEEPEERE